MATAEVGDVYCFKIFGGGYGAVQVVADKDVGKNRRLILLAQLDIDSATPPSLADLQATGIAPQLLLPNDSYVWAIDDFPPWWAQKVGQLPITQPPFTQAGAMGQWDAVRVHARLARRYRKGAPKPTYRWHRDAPTITVDLGGRPSQFLAHIRTLDGTERMPPAGQSVNWSGLRALSSLCSLTHTGTDRGLISAVSSLPMLERLTWRTPAEPAIDLRQTNLTEVTLSGIDHAIDILLPDSCARLAIEDRHDLVTIHATNTGEGFDLQLKGRFRKLPRQIETVQEAVFIDAGCIDIAALGAWPDLKSLRIAGAATRLENIGHLRALKQLRRFDGAQLYDFDAQAFPVDRPRYEISIDGLRADDAKILRKRLQHLPRAVFTKTRSDKWIAENLDNPFRDWDADGPAFGKAAVALWKEATRAATLIDGTAASEHAKAVVVDLVVGLNKLAARYEIDTLRREQACAAISHLASTHLRGALSAGETQVVIDEFRDW